MIPQCFGKSAIEALDHAIGLGMERLRQAMFNAVRLADLVKGVITRRLSLWFSLHVYSKFIREFATIVS